MSCCLILYYMNCLNRGTDRNWYRARRNWPHGPHLWKSSWSCRCFTPAQICLKIIRVADSCNLTKPTGFEYVFSWDFLPVRLEHPTATTSQEPSQPWKATRFQPWGASRVESGRWAWTSWEPLWWWPLLLLPVGGDSDGKDCSRDASVGQEQWLLTWYTQLPVVNTCSRVSLERKN